MYIRSTQEISDNAVSEDLIERLSRFFLALRAQFRKRRGRSNLLPSHYRTLSSLQSNPNLMVIHCDKNLGPAIVERDVYIRRVLDDHLLDESTYRRLSKAEFKMFQSMQFVQYQDFLKKYRKKLPDNEILFLRRHLKQVQQQEDSNVRFYILAKVHKSPWKTRPIVSSSGSLFHGLSIWLDSYLQKFSQLQPSYFKSSSILKQQLIDLGPLPPTARLFTSDAVSCYTNIQTGPALEILDNFLKTDPACSDYPINAIITALRLVMQRNIFQFGNTFWHQTSGTAMGTPCAPPYATIYYAVHEKFILEKYSSELLFYRRFIDDVFGIWVPDPAQPNRWDEFKTDLNFQGLVWETGELLRKVDYMDLTISINSDFCIQTTLFEKKLNLYLYIPNHSAHPPGVLSGLIIGGVLRIYDLCSHDSDRRRLLNKFYRRLRQRGYQRSNILSFFDQGLHLARVRYVDKRIVEKEKIDQRQRVFLHLPYHPQNPPSSVLQRVFREHLSNPSDDIPLSRMISRFHHHPILVDRMIVAYSRPRSLQDMFSYRKIERYEGSAVSSFID